MRGYIYQINRKKEITEERGLPKYSVEEVIVNSVGIEGDFNRYRTEKRGNTLERALLLLPWETIQDLNGEGWPVHPGDLGENITTQGIPYNLAIGATYYLGSQAVIQVSEACTPCVNLGLLEYVNKEKVSAFMKTLLGRRGWYARVLQEGKIRRGDIISSPEEHSITI